MAPDDRQVVDEALLTATGQGGLFGSGYLADRPLETHIESDERPQIVFPGRDPGVVHEHGAVETTHHPGSGYRVIVALTDRNVVIGVGGGAEDGGDEVFEISLTSIEHVEIEGDGRQSVLHIWTGPEETWHLYPAGVDLEGVASYLQNASQSWIRFERLLRDVRRVLTESARRRSAGEFEAAATKLERTEELLGDAKTTVETFDPSISELHQRLARTRERYHDEQRHLQLARASHHANQGRECWRVEDYETAADHFQRSRERYQQLLDVDVSTDVRERLVAVQRDLDRLSESPLRSAIAIQRAAERTDDPHEAVEYWREALERYRTALELDWGREPSRFAGETAAIRNRLETVVTGLLIARRRSADRASQTGARLAEDDQFAEAQARYEDAIDHLDGAISTAKEFAPAELEALRARRAEIEATLEEVLAERQATADTDRSFPALGNGLIHPDREGLHADDSGAASGEATPPGGHDDHREAYVRHLQTLDDGQATLAVGIVWRELGWTIELIDQAGVAVLATRSDRERPLALALRRRGVPLTAQEVETLAETSANIDGHPAPVMVTTDPVTASAFETAMAQGVTLVDSLRLGELARVTGVRPDVIDGTVDS